MPLIRMEVEKKYDTKTPAKSLSNREDIWRFTGFLLILGCEKSRFVYNVAPCS